MRPVVKDRVAWSVGSSVTIMNPAKTAEPIEMPFGIRTQSKEACIRWWFILAPPSEYDSTVRVRRRCCLFVKPLWLIVCINFNVVSTYVCGAGNAVSSRRQSWDDQWRCIVDNHQYRLCRVLIPRGDATRLSTRHTCASCTHLTGENGRCFKSSCRRDKGTIFADPPTRRLPTRELVGWRSG